MIKFEQEYLRFIRQHGVGERDQASSSPQSYLSYLRGVGSLLGREVSPGLLHSMRAIPRIVRKLEGRRAPKTLKNYASAMRLYVEMLKKRERLHRKGPRDSVKRNGSTPAQYWRMSFRRGNQGESLWQDCLKLGVAVITYGPLHSVDLSKNDPYEPRRQWGRLAPSKKFSLGAVAYLMRPKDVIYAKDGASIVGKGIVRSRYRFDPTVLNRPDVDWAHHVKVDWHSTFPVGLVSYVGPTQSTVHRLSAKQVSILERQLPKATAAFGKKAEAMEGRLVRCVRNARVRDAKLAQIKKTQSDYACEICDFHFERVYGELGRSYIVVHHLQPIGSRRRATRTTLAELVVVCPNCHVMLHREKPPLTPSRLRELMG